MRRARPWRARFKRGRRPPVVKNRVPLEEYEHAIIMGDLAELCDNAPHRYVSIRQLVNHRPGRYDTRHLGGALKRMQGRGLVYYKHARWTPFTYGGSVCLRVRHERQLAA